MLWFVGLLPILQPMVAELGNDSPVRFRMLCLGDSYTIGEGVAAAERFPEQTVALLQQQGISFLPPHIVATTGWTTDELMAALKFAALKPPYDVVTLLIGVNNQYRGRSVENYREEFQALLQQALNFSGSRPHRVVVLSIPDWGVTPFASDRNRQQIAREIDAYNSVNAAVAQQCNVHYLNITPYTRLYADWLTGDGLHPDGRQYRLWANDLAELIAQIL